MQLCPQSLGLDSFRFGQEEALNFLKEGRSLFVNLPTGSGKSLLFWAPVKLWQWRVVIVCPLISLIEDQVLSLQKRGLAVRRIHGANTENLQSLDVGAWDILLITPERLCSWTKSGQWSRLLKIFEIDLVVVDEVHCVLDWDFRAAFIDLDFSLLEAQKNGCKILCLSATLDQFQEQILRLRWSKFVEEAFVSVRAKQSPKNIFLQIKALEGESQRWISLISSLNQLKQGDSALVYTNSRQQTQMIASLLNAAGIEANYFHAGLPGSLKLQRAKDFKSGRLPVVVCTSAFGLGIDYSKIRKVIHWGVPYSLAQYWQEIGRAGRDGLAAESVVLWLLSDWLAIRRKNEKAKTHAMRAWKYWQADACRRRGLGEYYPQMLSEDCGNCDFCLGVSNGKPWWLRDFESLREFLDAL